MKLQTPEHLLKPFKLILRTPHRVKSGKLNLIFSLILFLTIPVVSNARSILDSIGYVSGQNGNGFFPLVNAGKTSPLFVSKDDFPGVIRAVGDLKADVEKVTGIEPEIINTVSGVKELVVVGTLGKNVFIDELVKAKKIDVSGIQGKWETFIIQVVDNPKPGIDRALVIVGSDKRGTIFGVYDVSAEIGVSPWYWWADVPAKKQKDLFIKPGVHSKGEPKVKYRGIFINDEAPALSGWTHEKNGGFNHKLYEKVFELILRMKGNYLWPAMWGSAFYDDDPLNPKLADEYGVVIGTSHHEPMMRAHDEWRRYGKGGKWNYTTNDSSLRQFWREGIKRMGNNESIVTLAMRGDGDEPMSEGTQVALLEKIVKDQRKIIEKVTGKPASETPQVWALYKEVQDYYDKGMRVPEDVTLLLCDDNWGNLRKLPKGDERKHKGGYGIYYHFDYVGGPRNYKWLNTNQIERTWEQMNLAYEYGATKLWLVNVGDIKPMEFPIQFFLDYAWNPEKITAKDLPQWSKDWAEMQFGPKHAAAIANILDLYTKYNSRRKHELLSPETYSLVNYREFERVVEDFNKLVQEAEKINNDLPKEYRDAFYQLVLFPTKASANLNELYFNVAKNRLYAKQGRASTNEFADKSRKLYDNDSLLTYYYNNIMADGKWSHMMDQTHIGYTYWQQPDKNSMPEVKRIELNDKASMAVAIEGSDSWWPESKLQPQLPDVSPCDTQGRYFEIFNRGKSPFDYKVSSAQKWVTINASKGKIEKEQRIWLEIDWKKASKGKTVVPITITGGGSKIVVLLPVNNPEGTQFAEKDAFVEGNGYVSIEAAHFTKAVNGEHIAWEVVPNLGRTSSAVKVNPVNVQSNQPGGNNPHLEYAIQVLNPGEVKVNLYFSPTLAFHNTGLKYAVSFDDEAPQIFELNLDPSGRPWGKAVSDNVVVKQSTHQLSSGGKHSLKFWLIDPGLVLQKVVVDTGGLKPSYLGPEESMKSK